MVEAHGRRGGEKESPRGWSGKAEGGRKEGKMEEDKDAPEVMPIFNYAYIFAKCMAYFTVAYNYNSHPLDASMAKGDGAHGLLGRG